MTLSEYFRREGKGSKSRLARAADLAYSTVHWIERGATKPRVDTAQKISAATGGLVSVEELLGLREPEDAAAE